MIRGQSLNGFCRGVYLHDIGSVHSVERFVTEEKFLKRLFSQCLRWNWSSRPFYFGVLCTSTQRKEKKVLEKIGAKFHRFSDDYECVIFTFTRKDIVDFIANRNQDLLSRFESSQLRPLSIDSSWLQQPQLPLFLVDQPVNTQPQYLKVGDRVRLDNGTTPAVITGIRFDLAAIEYLGSGYRTTYPLSRLRRIT